jgi:hypothetical protein
MRPLPQENGAVRMTPPFVSFTTFHRMGLTVRYF